MKYSGDKSIRKRQTLSLVCYTLVVFLLALVAVDRFKPTIEEEQSCVRVEERQQETSLFQKIYDSTYSALIEETLTSCDRSSEASDSLLCHPRKRIDFASFPFEASGGLSTEDRKHLEELYYNSDSVFEFGIGESTDIAIATNLPRYVGVDSSNEWIEAVRKRSPDRYRFFFADIGPTGAWGAPKVYPISSKMVINYEIAPLFLEKNPFDIYLVDGRFRVACVMASFLHAIHTGADMNKVRVLIHDYRARGSARGRVYGIVKAVANVEVDATDGMRLKTLSKKANATEADFFNLYELYSKKPN